MNVTVWEFHAWTCFNPSCNKFWLTDFATEIIIIITGTIIGTFQQRLWQESGFRQNVFWSWFGRFHFAFDKIALLWQIWDKSEQINPSKNTVLFCGSPNLAHIWSSNGWMLGLLFRKKLGDGETKCQQGKMAAFKVITNYG